MFRTRLFALALFAFIVPALLSVGCTAQSSEGAAAATVTDDQNGKTVEVRTGQVLNVSLKANPSTGYTWEVSQPLGFLLLQGEPEFKADSNLVGAPGRLTLRFKVTGAGSGSLQLVYHRLWEKGVEPIGTFTINVVAK
ncbi:MAG: protease inhibitor I42 family protein [Rudaea sp.]